MISRHSKFGISGDRQPWELVPPTTPFGCVTAKTAFKGAVTIFEHVVAGSEFLGDDVRQSDSDALQVPSCLTRIPALLGHWHSLAVRLVDAAVFAPGAGRRPVTLLMDSVLDAPKRALTVLCRQGGYPLDKALQGFAPEPDFPTS